MNNQQPPTREQVAAFDRLRADLAHGQEFGNRNIVIRVADLDAVLALLPQPTPSADQIISLCPRCGGSGCVGLADCRLCEGSGEVSNPAPNAAPPSIDDMAPEPTLAVGYAFTALASWSEEDDEPDRWRKLSNGRYSLVGAAPGVDWDAECINWSTIRDVTPPKGVQ